MSQSFHRGNLAAGTLCAICTGLALLLFVLAIIQLIAVSLNLNPVLSFLLTSL